MRGRSETLLYLTDQQKHARLGFVRAHEEWSVVDWGEVISIDESTVISRWVNSAGYGPRATAGKI